MAKQVNWAAYAEAYKRGILPDNKRRAFEEAVSRGLVPEEFTLAFETPQPIVQEPIIQEPVPEVSTGEAFREGVASGGTFGFADELRAGIGAGLDYITGTDKDFSKNYESLRDTYREEQDQAQEQHPWAFGVGSVTGAVPTLMAAPVSRGVQAVGKVAGGGLKGLAAEGAVVGAGYGLGETENITDLPQVAKDVGTGAVTGALGGLAAKGVTSAVGAVGSKAADIARRKASGFNKINIKGVGGVEKASEYAKEGFERGMISSVRSARTSANRLSEALEDTGRKIGEVYKIVDDMVGGPSIDVAAFKNEILKRSDQLYGKPTSILAYIDKIANGKASITLEDAHTIYMTLSKKFKIKNNNNPTDMQLIAKETTTAMRDILDEKVLQVAGPEQAQALQALNREFHVGRTLEKSLVDKASAEEGNKFLGLLGNVGGGSVTGGLLAAGGDLATSGGAGLAAGLATRLSSTRVPQMVGGLAQLLSKAPAKYKQILEQAAERGSQAVSATHFLLMKTDPEYRKKMLEEQ